MKTTAMTTEEHQTAEQEKANEIPGKGSIAHDVDIIARLVIWHKKHKTTSVQQLQTPIASISENKAGIIEETFEITSNTNTIGRDPDKNSIVIDSEGVSSEHATIVSIAGSLLLTACKTTNGTWWMGKEGSLSNVRMKPSLPRTLNYGDIFYCADVKCQIQPANTPSNDSKSYKPCSIGILSPAKSVSSTPAVESMTQIHDVELFRKKRSPENSSLCERTGLAKLGSNPNKRNENGISELEETTQRPDCSIQRESAVFLSQADKEVIDGDSNGSVAMFSTFAKEDSNKDGRGEISKICQENHSLSVDPSTVEEYDDDASTVQEDVAEELSNMSNEHRSLRGCEASSDVQCEIDIDATSQLDEATKEVMTSLQEENTAYLKDNSRNLLASTETEKAQIRKDSKDFGISLREEYSTLHAESENILDISKSVTKPRKSSASSGKTELPENASKNNIYETSEGARIVQMKRGVVKSEILKKEERKIVLSKRKRDMQDETESGVDKNNKKSRRIITRRSLRKHVAASDHKQRKIDDGKREYRILLTGHRLTRNQEKALLKLNVLQVNDVKDCTHLVLKKGKVQRTLKLLKAMALHMGPRIVHDGWLSASIRKKEIADEDDFVPFDKSYVMYNNEKKRLDMKSALKKRNSSNRDPLLENVAVIVTNSVEPSRKDLKCIISNAGGKLVTRIPPNQGASSNIIVLTCNADMSTKAVNGYRKQGLNIYDISWFTHGIVDYHLDWESTI